MYPSIESSIPYTSMTILGNVYMGHHNVPHIRRICFWGNFCFWYNFIELKLNFPEKKPSNNMNSIHDPEVITLKKSWANGILN